jgi:hypothetical protein
MTRRLGTASIEFTWGLKLYWDASPSSEYQAYNNDVVRCRRAGGSRWNTRHSQLRDGPATRPPGEYKLTSRGRPILPPQVEEGHMSSQFQQQNPKAAPAAGPAAPEHATPHPPPQALHEEAKQVHRRLVDLQIETAYRGLRCASVARRMPAQLMLSTSASSQTARTEPWKMDILMPTALSPNSESAPWSIAVNCRARVTPSPA